MIVAINLIADNIVNINDCGNQLIIKQIIENNNILNIDTNSSSNWTQLGHIVPVSMTCIQIVFQTTSGDNF